MSYIEPLPSAFKSPACSFWKVPDAKDIPAPWKGLSMEFHVCSDFKGSAVNKVDILAPCTLGWTRDRSIFGWERNTNRGKYPHHKSTRKSTYPEQRRGASLPRAQLLYSDLYQLESEIHRPQVFQHTLDCTTCKSTLADIARLWNDQTDGWLLLKHILFIGQIIITKIGRVPLIF